MAKRDLKRKKKEMTVKILLPENAGEGDKVLSTKEIENILKEMKESKKDDGKKKKT